MNELRSALLAEDELNDVDLTHEPVNSRYFNLAARQIGPFWAGLNEAALEVMPKSN